MKKRVITGSILFAIFALFLLLKFYVNDYIFDGLILAIAGLSAFEFSNILTKSGFSNYKYVAISYPCLVFIANFLGIWYSLPIWLTIVIDIAIMFALALGVFLFDICNSKTKDEIRIRNFKGRRFKFSIKRALSSLISFAYPSFLFMTMMFVNHYDILQINGVGNFDGYLSIIALATAFLIPILTDIFAMLTGMMFGGKKLCPKLSPKKTISGAIGGVVWSVGILTAIFMILNSIDIFYNAFNDASFAVWKYIIIIFVGSVIAQLGDLFESFMKRKANIKDSGKILPGHGGILDRVDSYIFEAPYVFLAFLLIVLI